MLAMYGGNQCVIMLKILLARKIKMKVMIERQVGKREEKQGAKIVIDEIIYRKKCHQIYCNNKIVFQFLIK